MMTSELWQVCVLRGPESTEIRGAARHFQPRYAQLVLPCLDPSRTCEVVSRLSPVSVPCSSSTPSGGRTCYWLDRPILPSLSAYPRSLPPSCLHSTFFGAATCGGWHAFAAPLQRQRTLHRHG